MYDMNSIKDEGFYEDNPGVRDVTCFFGTGFPTADHLFYDQNNLFPSNPKVIQGNGDGLVTEASIQVCKNWIKKVPVGRSVTPKVFNLNHFQLVSDKMVVDILTDRIAWWNRSL